MRKKLKLYFVRKELSKRTAELKEEQEIQKFFRNFFELDVVRNAPRC